MEHLAVTPYFSGSYAEARNKFLNVANAQGAQVESYPLAGYIGLLGEELAIDVAYLGRRDAKHLLIVSSGTHGPEGFAGSGCQVAMLQDQALIQKLETSDIGVLLIHALNPYGFSYLQRHNQDNVDLNRNHIDFNDPLPVNADYSKVHKLVIPDTWPPSDAVEAEVRLYIENHGELAFRRAVTSGQYSVPGGMFYGGTEPTWNNVQLRAILRQYAARSQRVGWIDIHTGLGPFGHGEKIYAGRENPVDVERARRWWGADVFAPFEGDSISPQVSGSVVSTIYDECSNAEAVLMGLEFGTRPMSETMYQLRASQWFLERPELSQAEALFDVRQKIRDSFYCDSDLWKGMVWGQTRTIVLQTLTSLADA
ncbi:M14 family metallopeptidase [Pandoraea sp. NPDC087047]|uniref:M14 family metallopeptidase n=1 Tax=Pandoraea sp. NPDC087047 TaxID=3364390 RepID=UPI0038219551